MSAYIEIRNCSKTIKQAEILKNINLDIEWNSVCGFVGRNGSGKTMLFKMLAGLLMPSGGQININGQVLSAGKTYPEKIGVMIENNGLWPFLNAYENLSILGDIRGEISPTHIRRAIRHVELADDKKTFSKYSLGMKQRLVFAQAIMEHPRLLILDEPTNALDKSGVCLFKDIIDEEVFLGATVLIASHSLEDFEGFCHKVVYMNGGEIESIENGGRSQ